MLGTRPPEQEFLQVLSLVGSMQEPDASRICPTHLSKITTSQSTMESDSGSLSLPLKALYTTYPGLQRQDPVEG
jgi:hypothetical protein